MTKQDYLQKSKHQKTAAWILMGGGATLLLTGIVIPKGALTHSGFLDDTYKNDGIKDAFDLTGIVSMLGSIPFFIASSKKKKSPYLSRFKMNLLKLQKTVLLTERFRFNYKNKFMKKIIIFTMFLITANATFSQPTNVSSTLTKQDYLQKSKHQKTAAWILVSGGSLCAMLGTIQFNFAGSDGEVNNSNSTVFLVTGLAAIGASIPFFIASS
ncbi:MAG: hypothetical protein IPQ06_09845 [Chitinophagaceae bacterium]|nr:hypothetical protein [Chitinophagaceae bacterium]